jgi:hypothetical protein
MDSQYQPLSASIHLDFSPPPRSLDALYNPKGHSPRLSRTLFHETVHFWQYLNSGYLMRLVEEDWSRLIKFEKSGDRRSDSPRRRHYTGQHPKHAMSPRDLVEVFVRFWDVQVVGPLDLLAYEIEEGRASAPIVDRYRVLERDGLLRRRPEGGYRWESFELAMEGPGGGWAEPYAILRKKSPPRAAGIFFPVAAALALKTDDPVSTYMFLMSGVADFEHALQAATTPHQLWKWGHDFLFDLVTKLPAEQQLGSGIKVAGEGPLGQTPFWKWLISYTLRAAAELAARDAPELPLLEAVPKGITELAFLLATPGDPDSRGLLIPLLLPPRVTYADGNSWNPAKDSAQSIGASEAELITLDQVSALSAQIADRWTTFRSSPRQA